MYAMTAQQHLLFYSHKMHCSACWGCARRFTVSVFVGVIIKPIASHFLAKRKAFLA